MSSFTIEKDSFIYNGEPVRIISGAMHYFRVPREYWRDRLLKIKACGFNTVETYTCWNLHEREEGIFDFGGMLDLKAYLELINELGMFSIVRPGPYICSEWEFGGFPWWLLKYDDIELRCMNKRYLEKVDAYFDKLIPIIAECEITNGGSVIMVQVENEYGSYGDDTEYLRYIADGLKKRGITSLLFTSDGDCDFMLTGGTVPEIFKTVNFGSDAARNFTSLRKFQPHGPLMCMEYWNGWFDHWGEEHHARNPYDAAETFRDVIECGGNINVYMMHGGTNFGFMNGANATDKEYQPTVNSYDDDAPVNEYGGLTEKYFLMKKVLEDNGIISDISVEQPETIAYPDVKLTEYCDLFSQLKQSGTCIKTTLPQTMEKLGQGYGYILYETFIRGPRGTDYLYINANDRAYVFINGRFKKIIYRNDKSKKIKITVPDEGITLTILVENMGRINYGAYLEDRKGIVEPVRFAQQKISHWNTYLLPMEDISQLSFSSYKKSCFRKKPVFLKGSFVIKDDPKDTFIDFSALGKGILFINGKLLSRYWNIGTQGTLYLPAPYLNKGVNEITVFETEAITDNVIRFSDKPVFEKILYK